MALNEIGTPLGLGRFGVGVIRRAQDGDKQFDGPDDARGRIDHLRLLAGVIDKELLAGRVHLSHREPLPPEPLAVVRAEGGIAIAVRMGLQILQVQELQRDAGTPQFGVDPGRIRERARRMAGNLRAIEPLFERVVAHPLECVARQPDAAGAADDRRDRAGTDPQAPRRLAVASLQLPFQSQNLSNVSHGQSVRRHRPLR